MAIFNCYVSSPEGIQPCGPNESKTDPRLGGKGLASQPPFFFVQKKHEIQLKDSLDHLLASMCVLANKEANGRCKR